MNAFNFATMREYSGKNLSVLNGLDFPAYATFNQIAELGGRIKKGAKSVAIFCGYRQKQEKKGDKVKQYAVPTYARVFHIEDCEFDPAFVEWVKDEIKKGAK